MTELRIEGLTRAYGSGPAVLSGVDLTVESGSLAAVLGPSGCGKTTLLRIIAGFLRADAGSVAVGGRLLTGPGTHVPPERRRIGIVPQEGALFPHLSVARNVAFGVFDRSARRHRVEEMLELVGLAGYGDRMPHELSGGQQQRVALARALAPSPTVVLLDEPFNALDSALRAAVRSDVRTALQAIEATAVLVTHDQEEALSTADLVAVLRNGQIAQAGPPHEVYSRPVDPWVARFVGEAVVLSAHTANGGGHVATTDLGSVHLRSPAAAPEGSVVLRPEQLQLTEPNEGARAATVTGIQYYGHDAMITVRVDGISAPVDIRVAGHSPFRPGDRAGVRITGEANFHPA